MLDCTDTLTHVFSRYDPVKRCSALDSESIENCLWFRKQEDVANDTAVSVADAVKVRIPLAGRRICPKIQNGDLLIYGTVNIQGMSKGKLRQEYQESMEVESVTYNVKGSPYTHHIRCSGS